MAIATLLMIFFNPANLTPHLSRSISPQTTPDNSSPTLIEYQSSVDVPTPDPFLKMKNPSAVYCQQLGYQYQVTTSPHGDQDGVCILPDEQICPAWDFLNGKCGQEHSICAKNGLSTITVADGNNPYSNEYAVCADGRGKLVDSVVKLSYIEESEQLSQTAYDLAQLDALAQPSTPYIPLGKSVPPSFDWRNDNGSDWTTPVKNQGICGSCWAFSAVGVAEAVTNIATNDPDLDPDLSEQYLVSDCTPSGSCAGGAHSIGLYYLSTIGATDEGCLPYTDGADTGCSYTGLNKCNTTACTYSIAPECSDVRCTSRCSNWETRLIKIQSYTYLGTNASIETMKTALVEHGPLAVAMYTGGSFDANQVYTCEGSPSPNHAVVIVGYDDAGGYWIVKNSWGSSWGPSGNGFFKVDYNSCAIQTFPYYADGIPQEGNPVPVITSVDPTSIQAGGSTYVLTVFGEKFVKNASIVQWNGSDRQTVFVSNSELRVWIDAADIASAGTASVAVLTNGPGGGVSNSSNIVIYTPSTLPFEDSFESDNLGFAWEKHTTDQGRVQKNEAYPHSGKFSMQVDDAINDLVYSHASATLHLNLEENSKAFLTFWWREFDDDNIIDDGVYIRGNSSGSWCQVMSFDDGAASFTRAEIDLQIASASCGIAFSSDFQVRFQFYGNEGISQDGFTLDDVQVVEGRKVFLPIILF